MRRKFKLIALFLLVAALLSGCMDFSALMDEPVDPNATAEPTMPPLTAEVYTDRIAAYEWYNEVSIGDMLDEVTEKYGEPLIDETEDGKNYTWTNEDGYGFAAVFFDDGRLRAKVLYYEDIRQLKDLSSATHLDNVTSLSKDYDFAMVCTALGGKPMEIASIAQDSSINPDVKRVFAWLDESGSCAQILFSSQEKLEQINYNVVSTDAE